MKSQFKNIENNIKFSLATFELDSSEIDKKVVEEKFEKIFNIIEYCNLQEAKVARDILKLQKSLTFYIKIIKTHSVFDCEPPRDLPTAG